MKLLIATLLLGAIVSTAAGCPAEEDKEPGPVTTKTFEIGDES